MHLIPALACAVIGVVAGLIVPWLIAQCPEPEHNPAENPDDYPDHVPFAELAARRSVRIWSPVACALSAGVLGLVVGWGWGLLWLLPLVPVCCALTVIDYVTWYLPSRLVRPAWAITGLLVGVVAVIVAEPLVALWGLIGFLALGGYYGLMRFLVPGAMAGGDIRLGALLGIALGPFGAAVLIVSAMAAAVLSTLAYVPMLLRGRAIKGSDVRGPLKHRVPYGPFLVLGALAAIVVGQVLGA